ncbi:MAG: hypothetical protein A3I77_01665 [Gammaproteobacteria bacterium RIFCSPLOWO2_02_FULL_42_14]|nr:MAG: hypothetical protein A3B71_07850 [Gammaproteobacteria bacterium RIFCSPHIGHO2_02_FULL_42_43]OGT52329.1 MAG: hypothetical protein A3E54_01725 [Gammaproteobacteria bacterium RIFCSPHIGHO2_12_FULL_41_25]OGT61941.1 MAG: hypothetical protein A3I77_01665 [Gammaproteobacteria bacterium RIFCSPLOWO2_02_FULL_42_14]OGT86348.1 MAG: hypothetical protein A3G86_07430 [Gammaproteobacteria bacterium RIFCSPLOWO2_12_FULL_42_18]
MRTNSANNDHASSWGRHGNFNSTYNSGDPLNRYAEYKCFNDRSLVDSIKLCGYVDGDFQIIVTAKDMHGYTQLRQSVVAAGFSQTDPTDRFTKTVRILTNQRYLITHFFETINQTDGVVGLIKDEIIQTIARIPDHNPRRDEINNVTMQLLMLQIMTLRNASIFMVAFIDHMRQHQNVNNVRLITAPPNNERRLIVRSTENRMALHQGNTVNHLEFALFSVMQLIGSFISATGIGMNSVPDLFVINDFSQRERSNLFGTLFVTNMVQTLMRISMNLSRMESWGDFVENDLLRAHVDLRAHHVADFPELMGNNPFYWPEHRRPIIFDFDYQPNLGALTTAGTFLSVERPIPVPQTGKNAKTLSEIAGFDTSNIPDEFCCHLSGEIMDDPVIDPTTLNAAALTWISAPESEKETLDRGNFDEVPRFERKWLERAVSDKDGDSPMTRQPIVTPLISDSATKGESIKKRIEDFVQSQVTSAATASSPRK